MGYDAEIYVDHKNGTFYVGYHGGEGECNHQQEGVAIPLFEEAMKRAVRMFVRHRPCNGIRVYGMADLFTEVDRSRDTVQ